MPYGALEFDVYRIENNNGEIEVVVPNMSTTPDKILLKRFYTDNHARIVQITETFLIVKLDPQT